VNIQDAETGIFGVVIVSICLMLDRKKKEYSICHPCGTEGAKCFHHWNIRPWGQWKHHNKLCRNLEWTSTSRYKKISYRWQTARRICANAMAWLT